LTDTAMPVHDVARASGFGSARRLHHLFQIRYRLSPGKLRQSGTRSGIAPPAEGGTLLLKLGYRPPLAWHPMLDFLGGRGASSAERVEGDVYLRTVRINDSTGWITARNNPQQCAICVEVSPSLLPVLPLLRSGVRQLFDLDANPDVIAAHLAQREELAPRLANTPGLRVPGAMNGFELALRAIIGQQISVRAATTIFSRIIEHFGSPITTPHAGLNRLPPTATAIADASTESLIACGLTGRRAQTIQTLARAVGNTEIVLEPGTAAAASLQRMALIPGIGPWTLQYVAMRALRDPDAFPESDLALLKSMNEVKPARLRSTAEPWRPWRAYAAMHIWNSLSAGG